MEEIYRHIGKLFESRAGRATTNAFAPLNLFAAISTPIFLLAGYYTNPPVNYFLYGMAMFVVIFCLIMYVVIFIKDPRLLQSERYRLEDKKLDIIQEKGGKAFIVNPVDLTPPPAKELSKYSTKQTEE